MRFLSVPLSVILHLAAVVAFLAWGFYGHEPEELFVPPVPIEIISRAEIGDEISVPETTTAEEPEVEPAAEEVPDPELEPEPVPEVVEPEPEPATPEPEPEAIPPLPEEEPEVEVVETEPEPEPEPVRPEPAPEPVEEEDDLLGDLANDLQNLDPEKQERTRPNVTNPDAFGADRDQERIGADAELSITEEAMLAACVRQNYRLDKTALNWETFKIKVRVRLNLDGTLAVPIEILNQAEINRSGNAAYQAAARNARAAISTCFPLDGLDPARYDSWKLFTYNFRPENF